MLHLLHRQQAALCDGLTRREWLRVGGIGLGGLSLPALLQARQAQAAVASPTGAGLAFGKAKSVIILWHGGGLPQHETFDCKPEAPAEIRGEFGSIDTKVPGFRIGELLPLTAQHTDKIAVLRAMVTNDNAHSSSGYQMLTGMPHEPLNLESALPKAPNLWPSCGGILRNLRQRAGQLPTAVTLPTAIKNTGDFLWPGQDAGFLGRAHDPWLVTCDPSETNFTVPDLALAEGLSSDRFERRQSLLSGVNRHLDELEKSPAVAGYSLQTQQAVGLLSASKARSAFDLTQESPALRDRYGRGRFAQSVLLARRLVEAGVSLVHVNWTIIPGQLNFGSWDTHEHHNKALKTLLMPIIDSAYSTLLEDLSERGLLDETLVVSASEFGHTPRFNGNGGRDHWGQAFSVALAGGGIRGGQIYGKTDAQAAYPISGRLESRDLIATIFHCLGYAPEAEMRDNLGRPLPISRGHAVEAIL